MVAPHERQKAGTDSRLDRDPGAPQAAYLIMLLSGLTPCFKLHCSFPCLFVCTADTNLTGASLEGMHQSGSMPQGSSTAHD